MTSAGPWSAVVRELQGDVEVGFLEHRNDALQVVPLLAGHAQLVALDLRLDALRALASDALRDRLGGGVRDPLLDGGRDPELLAGRLRLLALECLERDTTLDQLLLEDVQDGLRALVTVRLDEHAQLAGPGDGCTDAAEVVPVGDLLRGLIESVVDLLTVDLADDVERRVGHGKRLLGSDRRLRMRGLIVGGGSVKI